MSGVAIPGQEHSNKGNYYTLPSISYDNINDMPFTTLLIVLSCF